jgi:hypothetical protein
LKNRAILFILKGHGFLREVIMGKIGFFSGNEDPDRNLEVYDSGEKVGIGTGGHSVEEMTLQKKDFEGDDFLLGTTPKSKNLMMCGKCRGPHFNVDEDGVVYCASVSQYTDYKVVAGGCGWKTYKFEKGETDGKR